jgi:aspartate/methionine/tyrosine aminotransferase
MQAPRIDIFEWLNANASKATHNLAYSNIPGLTVEEYQRLIGFSLPKDFDLGINEHAGAKELKAILVGMYRCAEENIVTTTGATEANYLLFSSLLQPGDEFIVEQPSYQPIWLTPEMLGARRVPWQRSFEDRYHLNVGALEPLITKKTKLIVITNLHNPSGVWADRTTVESIAQIAEAHDLYILVDELFLDGSFQRHPSTFGIPRVIVTMSATKVYGLGGLHTGWIVAPEDVSAECQRRKAHNTGAASYVSEVMTAHAFGTAREKLIDRFQNRAQRNLKVLKKWMQGHQDLLDWVEPDGGIVCFPKYHLDVTSIPLCRWLFDEAGILVNPGAFFNQEGHFRMSYGIESEALERALGVLADALARFKTLQ